MPMSRQIAAEFDPSCHDFLLIKVRTSASSALGYVLGIIFPGSIYSNSAAFVTKDPTFTIKHLTPKPRTYFTWPWSTRVVPPLRMGIHYKVVSGRIANRYRP